MYITQQMTILPVESITRRPPQPLDFLPLVARNDAAANETLLPPPSKNATDPVGWQACQTSQISWSDAWSSAYQPEVVTETYTFTNNYYTVTANVTFGNSDVYTTIDGIPHAHGEIEPTSMSQFVESVQCLSRLR